MKRLSWKYLAGLIDGEGCLDVQLSPGGHIRPRLRIGLVATSRFLLDMIVANHGGYLSERKGSGTHQDSISWELCGYDKVCSFLRNVVNHLLLKKEQARFLLWLELNIKGRQVSTEVRDAIREELKLARRDPHRLSEQAQERILGCDSRKP